MWLDRPGNEPDAPVEGITGEMTTTEVMWYIKAKNMRAANAWLTRHNVQPHGREPGSHGDNLYWRRAVVEARERMPGQGKGGGWHMHAKRREAPQ